MKAIVEDILAKSYDLKTKKYFAWCRVKIGDGWTYRYRRIPFDTEQKRDNLKAGDFVKIEP